MHQIVDNLSTRAWKVLNKDKIKRTSTHMELIGCSREQLKEHLEKQFVEGMSFDNYGKWEIDHIKPISLFDLENNEEMLICFNHTNLQPLWKLDNIKKSNKYIEPISAQ